MVSPIPATSEGLPGLQREVNYVSPFEVLDWRKLPLQLSTHPGPTRRVWNSPPEDSPRHLNAKPVCVHVLLLLRSPLGTHLGLCELLASGSPYLDAPGGVLDLQGELVPLNVDKP